MLKKIKECTYKEFERSFELNSSNSNYMVVKKGIDASKGYLKKYNVPENLVPQIMEETFRGIVTNIDQRIVETLIEIDCEK